MSYVKKTINLPSMTPGTSRHFTVHHFGKPGAGPKAYIQSSIHANEFPGAIALHYLLPMLVQADKAGRIKGEIIVVPAVNPIGMSQLVGNRHAGRYDLLGYDNFNRNWPELSDAVARRVDGKLGRNAADNVALIRAALRAAVAALRPMKELQVLRREVMSLCCDADVVLDLHCDEDALLHVFISRPDWPGPAREFAADIGAQAVVYNDPYPTSSTFSGVNAAIWPRLAERFPQANIPRATFSCTVELRGEGDVSDAIGTADANGLYRFLVRRGLVSGRAGALPRLKTQATPRQGEDIGYAPRPGILIYHVKKGVKVRKGQPICDIVDPWDARGPKARTTIVARTDGVLFTRKRDGKLAWPGLGLFRIAGTEPLAHRKGMSGLDD